MLARVRSGALRGIEAIIVDVEVDVASGLPHTTTVGLPARADGASLDAESADPYKKPYNWEDWMDVVGYSAARQQLAKLMDSVVEDRRPVIVTRRRAPAVIMLALEEYEAMAETLHLVRSPKNTRRLQKAIRDANARRFVRNPRG